MHFSYWKNISRPNGPVTFVVSASQSEIEGAAESKSDGWCVTYRLSSYKAKRDSALGAWIPDCHVQYTTIKSEGTESCATSPVHSMNLSIDDYIPETRLHVFVEYRECCTRYALTRSAELIKLSCQSNGYNFVKNFHLICCPFDHSPRILSSRKCAYFRLDRDVAEWFKRLQILCMQFCPLRYTIMRSLIRTDVFFIIFLFGTNRWYWWWWSYSREPNAMRYNSTTLKWELEKWLLCISIRR